MIQMLVDIKGTDEVMLSNGLFVEMGIARETKRRGLVALEGAGLIQVKRSPGRLPRVMLAPPSCRPESQTRRSV